MNKVALSLTVLAFVASSMTLWLLESSLKYVLYFFEVALILTRYHPLSGNFKKVMFKIERKAATKLCSNLSIHTNIAGTIVTI